MKRFLIFVLAFMLVFPLAACDNGEDVSGEMFSKVENSKAAVSSEAEVSDQESDGEESSEAENTEESPEFIANFLSIGAVDTNVKATSTNAIRLTGIDTELSYGSIVLYTPDYGTLSSDGLAEYAVAVFDYSGEYFGYVKTAFYEAGTAEDIEIPEDGFVVAAHSYQELYISRLSELAADETVFPHGLHLYDGADYSVKKTETAPSIDGDFSEAEWGGHLIDEIDSTNPSWSYAQFEVGKYYSTASYYTTYDDKYLYLCVVVDSPYHYCPITQSNAGDMWKYECIQVKVSSESPDSEYILTNFDHVANSKAVKEGVVRSYGFAVNDEGETCYYESGFTSSFTGLAACSRDDASQLTVYEAAIPFEEFGITPEAGLQMGLTFSINSTNEDDIAANIWKNITYRNGGGVIGRNDWSKIPVITLE